jgi:hypothetical protein
MRRFATQPTHGTSKVRSMNKRESKILSGIFVTCGVVLVVTSMFNQTHGVQIFILGLVNVVIGSTGYFRRDSKT